MIRKTWPGLQHLPRTKTSETEIKEITKAPTHGMHFCTSLGKAGSEVLTTARSPDLTGRKQQAALLPVTTVLLPALAAAARVRAREVRIGHKLCCPSVDRTYNKDPGCAGDKEPSSTKLAFFSTALLISGKKAENFSFVKWQIGLLYSCDTRSPRSSSGNVRRLQARTANY